MMRSVRLPPHNLWLLKRQGRPFGRKRVSSVSRLRQEIGLAKTPSGCAATSSRVREPIGRLAVKAAIETQRQATFNSVRCG